ncbi:hypothetical protein H5410_010752 [Solanum commersonii]|uniref:Uncharacterized protein n=1 Tax=Solanum commersonii TaxID=4109 RepID=A0A9J6ALM8_SOLCO|nr:hypothetical protein H5410_010752 [Solanum commersonii]
MMTSHIVLVWDGRNKMASGVLCVKKVLPRLKNMDFLQEHSLWKRHSLLPLKIETSSIVVKLPLESFDRIPERIFVCFSQQKLDRSVHIFIENPNYLKFLTEDDPAETKLGMLFISSSRQAEDPSWPETSTPTCSLWLSRAKRRGFISADTGGVNEKLEVLRQIIETKVFRLSKTKTKYFACNFDDVTLEAKVEVRNNSQIIPKTKRGNFKYLGSIIIGDRND